MGSISPLRFPVPPATAARGGTVPSVPGGPRPSPSGLKSISQPNPQSQSPFFGTLPAELRALIFAELFGNRRVHLELVPHPVRGNKIGRGRRWRHGLCEDDPATVPFSRAVAHQHHCLTGTRHRLLDISMLFTCRRALIEGHPILYQRNVFFIINTRGRRLPVDDIRSLQVKVPKQWSLIQQLEIKWEVAPFDRNQETTVPHFRGREAYEAFWDALAEMPSLIRLRIALLMPRWSPTHSTPSPAELRDSYLGPVGRLKNLRMCEVVMPKSYMSLETKSLIGLRRAQGGCDTESPLWMMTRGTWELLRRWPTFSTSFQWVPWR